LNLDLNAICCAARRSIVTLNRGVSLNHKEFTGWEGGLAPAQDPKHPQPRICEGCVKFLSVASQFSLEWRRILSGGKPTFPTCKLYVLEWLLDVEWRRRYFSAFQAGTPTTTAVVILAPGTVTRVIGDEGFSH
jgi:hypothetical protein